MRRLVFSLFCFAFLTSGCISLADPQASQVYNQEIIATLDQPGAVFQQTFTANRSRLNSLTFWLSGDPNSTIKQGQLIVELYEADGGTTPFYRGIVSANTIQQKGPLKLSFEPRTDPPGQVYLLQLHAQDSVIHLHGRNEDAFPYGVASTSQGPLQADLAFSTTYNYSTGSIIEDLKSIVQQKGLLLPLLVILFLPGWFLLELAGVSDKVGFWIQIALSLSLSLATLPIIMLWTSLVNLPWRAPVIWSVAASILIILYWKWFRTHKQTRITFPSLDWLDWLLAFILIVSLFVRLVMVRDMVAPAWVDSVHHALLGRLIAEQGRFPTSFLPYFQIDLTSYHLGFHTILAALYQLSNEDLVEGLLILGQVLNALAVLAAYMFTFALTADRRAGIVAALATGLFSPMPAYYTSWGRYTQLDALLILPAPIMFWQLYLKANTRREKYTCLFLSGLASGGLFLVHYRVAGFLALFAISYLLWHLFEASHPVSYRLRRLIEITLVSTVTASVLTAPWLGQALVKTILPTASLTSGPSQLLADFSMRLLTSALGGYVLVLALLGMLLAQLQKEMLGFVLPNWILLLLFIASLGALGLPGGGLVNLTSVTISFFLPISTLAGYLVSQLLGLEEKIIPTHLRKLSSWLTALLVIVLSLVGARYIVTILNPDTYLVRAGDLKAIAWIKDHIPPDERFLVNPFLWGYGVYAGNDGGYWISALSGQPTIPPPVIGGLNYDLNFQKLNSISLQVIQKANDAAGLYALLKENKITYVYLGVRGGPLSGKVLAGSNHFELIYHADGVEIFALR